MCLRQQLEGKRIPPALDLAAFPRLTQLAPDHPLPDLQCYNRWLGVQEADRQEAHAQRAGGR